MNYNRFKTILLPCVAMAGAIALTGCTDSDYDFNNIDATVGIGGDGLTLPVNSTDTIKLADVLELENSDCVVEEPNGDYVFKQEGENVDPVYPQIDKITVSKTEAPEEGEIVLHVVPAAGGYTVSASGNAQSFKYSGDKPEEVKSLSTVGTSGNINLNVTFPQELGSACSSIKQLSITLPAYMQLGDISSSSAYTVDGSRLVFTNVPTNRTLTVNANVTGFNIKAEDKSLGSITLDDAAYKINMTGQIKVDVTADINSSAAANVDGKRIRSTLDMGDIVINNARGVFAPEITLNDLGTVDVTGVPDFLDDNEVYIDLYNPIIKLSVSNDMAVNGIIDGTVTSYKDGDVIKSIELKNIPINCSTVSGQPRMTNVYICRHPEALNLGEGDVSMQVDDLSELIKRVPDQITFTASARADQSTESYFEFGKKYEVKPAYSFEAPITFAENAKIVYKDTLDGWNDDIKDFDLSEGAKIEFNTTIENRVPAYLNLEVKAIDANGNEMSDDEIKVEVSTEVLASAKEGQSAETPLAVVVTEGTQGAFKRLDGLTFRVAAAAQSSEGGKNPVIGQTLNARKHFLIARDITVKLVGKIIGDFN